MTGAVEIRPADPRDAGPAALIRRHAAQSDSDYPAESNHNLGSERLAGEALVFLAATDGETCLGIGALVPLTDLPGNAEIKSMHVAPEARGRGLGSGLLDALLAEARVLGLARLWLETGSGAPSAAARGLYAARGFSECPPFGAYTPDPNSVFMTLDLR